MQNRMRVKNRPQSPSRALRDAFFSPKAILPSSASERNTEPHGVSQGYGSFFTRCRSVRHPGHAIRKISPAKPDARQRSPTAPLTCPQRRFFQSKGNSTLLGIRTHYRASQSVSELWEFFYTLQICQASGSWNKGNSTCKTGCASEIVHRGSHAPSETCFQPKSNSYPPKHRNVLQSLSELWEFFCTRFFGSALHR